jgi:porphobilinogen deaminase
MNAGCNTPVAAYAQVDGATITLRVKLFTDDWSRCAEGVESGVDPIAVGTRLAERLQAELKE